MLFDEQALYQDYSITNLRTNLVVYPVGILHPDIDMVICSIRTVLIQVLLLSQAVHYNGVT